MILQLAHHGDQRGVQVAGQLAVVPEQVDRVLVPQHLHVKRHVVSEVMIEQHRAVEEHEAGEDVVGRALVKERSEVRDEAAGRVRARDVTVPIVQGTGVCHSEILNRGGLFSSIVL